MNRLKNRSHHSTDANGLVLYYVGKRQGSAPGVRDRPPTAARRAPRARARARGRGGRYSIRVCEKTVARAGRSRSISHQAEPAERMVSTGISEPRTSRNDATRCQCASTDEQRAGHGTAQRYDGFTYRAEPHRFTPDVDKRATTARAHPCRSLVKTKRRLRPSANVAAICVVSNYRRSALFTYAPLIPFRAGGRHGRPCLCSPGSS